jgi:hypothetical protein
MSDCTPTLSAWIGSPRMEPEVSSNEINGETAGGHGESRRRACSMAEMRLIRKATERRRSKSATMKTPRCHTGYRHAARASPGRGPARRRLLSTRSMSRRAGRRSGTWPLRSRAAERTGTPSRGSRPAVRTRQRRPGWKEAPAFTDLEESEPDSDDDLNFRRGWWELVQPFDFLARLDALAGGADGGGDPFEESLQTPCAVCRGELSPRPHLRSAEAGSHRHYPRAQATTAPHFSCLKRASPF